MSRRQSAACPGSLNSRPTAPCASRDGSGGCKKRAFHPPQHKRFVAERRLQADFNPPALARERNQHRHPPACAAITDDVAAVLCRIALRVALLDAQTTVAIPEVRCIALEQHQQMARHAPAPPSGPPPWERMRHGESTPTVMPCSTASRTATFQSSCAVARLATTASRSRNCS